MEIRVQSIDNSLENLVWEGKGRVRIGVRGRQNQERLRHVRMLMERKKKKRDNQSRRCRESHGAEQLRGWGQGHLLLRTVEAIGGLTWEDRFQGDFRVALTRLGNPMGTRE